MKILLFAIVFLFACKNDKSVESPYFKKQQIDNLINGQARLVRNCYEDSSFNKRADGKIDTSIRTFFCDTLGRIYLIRNIFFFSRTKALYLTYFSKGNVIKVVEEFSAKDYSGELDHSEYYIDHDTTFAKQEAEHKFSRMDLWMPKMKKDYRDFDSIKRSRQ